MHCDRAGCRPVSLRDRRSTLPRLASAAARGGWEAGPAGSDERAASVTRRPACHAQLLARLGYARTWTRADGGCAAAAGLSSGAGIARGGEAAAAIRLRAARVGIVRASHRGA